MDPIARAEADAEPEPESDLELDAIDAHLSSFLSHLVQPPRTRVVDQAEPDANGEPEPEPDLDLDSIDDHLSTSLSRFVQLPRSLPIPSMPLVRCFAFMHRDHTPRAERCMGQDDLYGRYTDEERDPNVPWAEVIDSVDAHEPSVGVASTGVASTGDVCTICFLDVKAGPLACTTPCSHLFHVKCLLEAMRVNPKDTKNCPLCRSEFPDGN